MKKEERAKRVRVKLRGTKDKPRLTVFRSNKFIYAQVIDDESGKTIIAATEKELKAEGKREERAKALGALIAKKALSKKVSSVIFDRGSYRYHGRVKQVAEGAREGGLKL